MAASSRRGLIWGRRTSRSARCWWVSRRKKGRRGFGNNTNGPCFGNFVTAEIPALTDGVITSGVSLGTSSVSKDKSGLPTCRTGKRYNIAAAALAAGGAEASCAPFGIAEVAFEPLDGLVFRDDELGDAVAFF